jgi:zinc transporter 1/2/3
MPSYSLQLRIGACFEIFALSMLGYFGALYLAPQPTDEDKNSNTPSNAYCIFSVIKAFSAGIILGVAMIHLVNESAEILSEMDDFPVAYTLVCAGIVLQLGAETFILQYATAITDRIEAEAAQKNADGAIVKAVPTSEVSDAAITGTMEENKNNDEMNEKFAALEGPQEDDLEATKAYVKAVGLECSIALHSIVIGFDLGLLGEEEIGTIRTLMVAFGLHQFFEAIALASVVKITGLSWWVKALFGFIVAMTLPIGIMIGIGTSNQTTSGEYTRASFDAIAGGVLIYSCLSEMVAEDFHAPLLKRAHITKGSMVFAFAAGVGIMALLANYEGHAHGHDDHDEDHDGDHDEEEDHDDERRLMNSFMKRMLKMVM